MKKKIHLLTAIAAAALLGAAASCSLDKFPEGTIGIENAFLTMEDADRLRDGLYIVFRANAAGSTTYSPELMTDLFHATSSFGNRGGAMYNWIFTADDADADAMWANYYSAIANINFFIDGAAKVDRSTWSEEDSETLDIWTGEAYFLRAWYYSRLAERYCLTYKGNENSFGIPYSKVYSPSSDQTTYMQRGTLQETYANIIQDLDSASALVTTRGSVGSIWITEDAVDALRARVALSMGDYATAITLASPLIDEYPLVAGADEFRQIWSVDSGKECILQLDAAYPDALPSSYSYNYTGYNALTGIYTPDYVPEQWVIDLFSDFGEDMRFTSWYLQATITMTGNAKYDLYLFNKFPGNPDLRERGASNSNYIHKVKPFRIAEMYLLLAEAYARSNQEGPANEMLTSLRSNRIPGYTAPTYSGETLLNQILEERIRELMGEGFYLDDLKRFGKPVERRAAQQSGAIYLPGTNEQFYRGTQEDRFVWPIPQAEIDANPNIAGQQNSGY